MTLQNKTGSITYDPDIINLNDIRSAIEDMGFEIGAEGKDNYCKGN